MTLTIIIPAYNAENTLSDSIESALKCFKHHEILIIDDGSIDATGEISEQYASKYKNVTVIHTSNGGVSKARNLGIEKATGDYLIFMDADDRIVYNGKLDIDEQIKDCDMLLFSFNERKMNGKLINTYIFEDKYIKKNKVVNTFLCNKYSFYGPWSKIYKRDIILKNNIRFNIGQKYGEDIVFVLSYLSHISKGIRLLSNVFYSHYINPKGASYSIKYYDDMNWYMFSQLQAFEKIFYSVETKNEKVLNEFASSLFVKTILHYYQRLNKKDFVTKYRESYKIFKHYIKNAILRRYPLFTFLRDDSTIDDLSTIQKFYKKNYLQKVRYQCKKIVYKISDF